MYKSIVRPTLFRMSPEKSHHFALGALQFFSKVPGISGMIRGMYQKKNPVRLMGLDFPNRVGLAAGFDKNAEYIHGLQNLGFGFIEIGTVTPKPQDGNPQPRLFRLTEDEGLINRMGFNNDGLDRVVERLKNRPKGLIIGGNIGKNKVTPNENALDDYLKCFNALHPYVDYFTVNVSSPNTPGLRELQEKEPLTKLLKTLQEENAKLEKPRPMLLKIAPDMEKEQLDDIIDIIREVQLDGIIATNTTISRENLQTNKQIIEEIGAGGVSGKPVKEASTAVVKYLREKGGNGFVIIASGGIFTAQDAQEKMDAGADLVQVYTGFIYEGPKMVSEIAKSLN
jgi:dihydroorotate dehydrogenase